MRMDEGRFFISGKGKPGFFDNTFDHPENSDLIEKEKHFHEFQEEALAYFESLGIAKRVDDQIIVQINKIKNFGLNFPGERYTVSYTGKKPNQDFLKKFEDIIENSTMNFLFYAFRGKQVVDADKWDAFEKGEVLEQPEAMDLFYAPKSLEEAFDEDKIREASFYLAPWKLRTDKLAHDGVYPGGDESIPYFEAMIACEIFHPSFGDGDRGKDGKLRVVIDGQKKVMNQKFFNSWKQSSDDGKQLFESPRAFLQDGGFPHLQETGMLRSDDFRYLSTHEKNRYDIYKDITHPKGYVMIGGIRYCLGSEFAPKPGINEVYRVYKISDKYAGVACITKDPQTYEEVEVKLVHMFDLLSDDPEHPLRKKEKKSSFIDVTAKYTNLRSYPPTEEETEGFDESKFEAGNDFVNFIALRRAVAKEAGFDFMKLSPLEQEAFLQYFQSVDETGKRRLYKFLKDFGINGAKTFSAVYVDPQSVEKIFVIVQNYEPVQAQLIFQKYAEFTLYRQKIDRELKDFFVDENDSDLVSKGEITQNMMKRAAQILDAYATRQYKVQKTAILHVELSKIQVEAGVFVAILKNLKKDGVELSLEKIRNVNFSCRSLESITPQERQEMCALYSENYKDNPEFRDELLQKFVNLLDSRSEKTRLYLLKNKERIVGFDRFDDQDDGTVYFGSFNVDEKYQGASLGRSILERTIDTESKNKRIVADCDTRSFISQSYIGRGFVARKFYIHKGISCFEIVRDDTKNTEYEYKNKSEQEIVSLYDMDEDGIVEVEDLVISRSNQKDLGFPFELLGDGYVVTKYFSKGDNVYAVFEKSFVEEEFKAKAV
jgi:hypothetical protein